MIVEKLNYSDLTEDDKFLFEQDDNPNDADSDGAYQDDAVVLRVGHNGKTLFVKPWEDSMEWVPSALIECYNIHPEI